MNHSKFITTVLATALLLGSVVPALAEDSVQSSSTVEINAQTPTVHIEIENKTEQGDQNSEESDTPHLRGENRFGEGSSTDEMRSSHGDRLQKKLENEHQRGEEAIDKRIKSLTELSARLASITLLSPEALASIQASLTAEIAKLTELKTKIDSDTATSTLMDDLGDIKKSNRVYLVVEPKARIAASASRINAVVTQMQAFVVKLEARIALAQTAGVDVSLANTALTDLQAKIADAKVQADSAVSLTVNLAADNGDASIKASNMTALKDARAKIELAQKDLADARHDAGTIRGIVKGSE